MTTLTAPRTSVKRSSKPRPQPALEVACEPAAPGAGADFMVIIHQGGKPFTYWLRRLAADFGVAFRFEQSSQNARRSEMQADSYDCCVEADRSHCDCVGFLHHGHCKHTEALRILVARGALALPAKSEEGGYKPECPF